MLSHISLLLSLSALILSVSAAPVDVAESCSPLNSTCYTQHDYYANFEAVPNGTIPTTLQGLRWTGFQTTTETAGIVPEDCPYIGPARSTNCHYALAPAARAANLTVLPTLLAAPPATLMRLSSLALAAGPASYFGFPGENITLIGLTRSASGALTDSGDRATFNYNTAENAGANGASMVNVSTPAEFVHAGYAFNVTTAGADEPWIVLDDVRIVTFTPREGKA